MRFFVEMEFGDDVAFKDIGALLSKESLQAARKFREPPELAFLGISLGIECEACYPGNNNNSNHDRPEN